MPKNSTEEFLERLAGWGPHLDHGGFCLPDERFRPRRLRATYPCPVHHSIAKRIGGRSTLFGQECDPRENACRYRCPQRHTFMVRRRPWPKGDSYWWEEPADDVAAFIQADEAYRWSRLTELGAVIERGVILTGGPLADDGEPHYIPAARVIRGPQLERFERQQQHGGLRTQPTPPRVA